MLSFVSKFLKKDSDGEREYNVIVELPDKSFQKLAVSKYDRVGEVCLLLKKKINLTADADCSLYYPIHDLLCPLRNNGTRLLSLIDSIRDDHDLEPYASEKAFAEQQIALKESSRKSLFTSLKDISSGGKKKAISRDDKHYIVLFFRRRIYRTGSALSKEANNLSGGAFMISFYQSLQDFVSGKLHCTAKEIYTIAALFMQAHLQHFDAHLFEFEENRDLLASILPNGIKAGPNVRSEIRKLHKQIGHIHREDALNDIHNILKEHPMYGGTFFPSIAMKDVSSGEQHEDITVVVTQSGLFLQINTGESDRENLHVPYNTISTWTTVPGKPILGLQMHNGKTIALHAPSHRGIIPRLIVDLMEEHIKCDVYDVKFGEEVRSSARSQSGLITKLEVKLSERQIV
eukprot:g1099.t1